MVTIERAAMIGVFALACSSPAGADIVCPEASYCLVEFNRTYEGNWDTGAPYDYVTIVPGNRGETFADVGVSIEVYLRSCQGDPCVGIPAERVVLVGNGLCMCTESTIADEPSDVSGRMTFSGALNAGGCSSQIEVWVDGTFLCVLADASGRAVKVNGPDLVGGQKAGHDPETREHLSCVVDSSDLAWFASVFASPTRYTICADFNESGTSIDASDLAAFAHYLGTACLEDKAR